MPFLPCSLHEDVEIADTAMPGICERADLFLFHTGLDRFSWQSVRNHLGFLTSCDEPRAHLGMNGLIGQNARWVRYAEKTVNNGIERGYTLDAGTRVSVNVYQNESWAQMPDEELFDTLNDLNGKYCVTEDQETIGERLNALFKSGELFEKIYPVVVSENNTENFTEAGITFDRYLDMLITYRVELMQMNDGVGTIRLQDSHLETFGISRQKIREAAFANLEGIVDFMTLRDDASGFKMVAATRKDKQFGGAASMLLPSVRRRLAEMFGTDSLVFLPSSISEVIVVAQTAGEPETLLAMVHEINEMEVALEERLTDSIYPMCLADGEYRLSVIRPR